MSPKKIGTNTTCVAELFFNTHSLLLNTHKRRTSNMFRKRIDAGVLWVMHLDEKSLQIRAIYLNISIPFLFYFGTRAAGCFRNFWCPPTPPPTSKGLSIRVRLRSPLRKGNWRISPGDKNNNYGVMLL